MGITYYERANLEMSDMSMDKVAIEKRLKELEEEIGKVLKRLPAHFVKPPIMTELLVLEDERDILKAQLEKMAC